MDDRSDQESPAAAPNPWREPIVPIRAHEPPVNLAWPAAALVAVFLTLYMAQSFFVDPADPTYVVGRFGFIPAALLQGGWYQPLTALFVHGSWAHVLVNSAFAIAFGQPVARRFGLDAWGGALFFLFFLICGLVGNLGYGGMHANGLDPVVGASGGIAGLMAAASRLMGRPPGDHRLAPLNSPAVVVMSAAILTTNLLIGLFHINAGFGSDGAGVAWETHIAGFIAGLLLIEPFVKAAGTPRFHRRKD